MRVLPYGDRALLVELDSTAEVVAYADAVRDSPAAELVEDVIPGARTVLLKARAGVPLARLEQHAESRVLAHRIEVSGARDEDSGEPANHDPRLGAPKPSIRREVEIPVAYDGPDLRAVAELTGLTEDEVVAAHTGTPWRVAFGGFAPGFAYLVGGDERLQVPRRDEPRTSVPAGAVGLAGEFSGVYPRSSPGGWQLIGTTEEVLWDLDRDPPALLEPGATVRFVAR